jgi:hypothetical protein
MKRIRLMGICLVTVFAMGAVAASSASALPKALIDEATVSGGAASQEANIAGKAGFEVTVVSDATWAAMTAAEFGQYELLIAGDPTCSTLPPGISSSASVYGPVVMGTAGGRTASGNRTIVGTDPVYHDGGSFEAPGARGTIIREGIDFAGKILGRTGMYFDATCAGPYGQSAQILEVLNSITASSPAWTVDALPPCGGNVSLIAANPSFSELTTESLEGWGCSVHESFPTFPTEYSALAVATDTESHPTCGVDPNTGLSACGEAYILIAGAGTVVKSEQIELTPLESTNPAFTNHTVTAHVSSEKTPVEGQVVTFSVTGVNAGASGTCVPASCATDSSGNATFTYHDTNGAGEDTIKASFTDKKGSLQSATAVKHWTASTGCAISDKKVSPFTDVATGKPVYAEDNLASTITPISPVNSAPEHLTVSGNGHFFTLTGVTSVLCHDNTKYPLDSGNKFNTVSGIGSGTFGTVFGTGKPGYTARFEFSDGGDQPSGSDTGGDRASLIVYDSLGHVVWHVNGKFTTASQEETG